MDKEKYFGEGIVFLKDKLYQLTYQTHKGFVYDAGTFKRTGEFDFTNQEGWSFTTDGTRLIMSDGTDTLTYLDPVSCKPTGIVKVTMNGAPRDSLNELEYIKGFIYANVWYTEYILKIDPALEGKQIERLQAVRARRDSRAVETRLAALEEAAAREDVNLMPLIVDAARDYVTLGEMCDALRTVWGVWRETPVF